MQPIIVSESQPGKFEARLGGRLLCTSRQPLLDAVRKLVAEGHDPGEVLVMRHSGSTVDALTARLGTAAKWTSDERVTRFRRWKPFQDASKLREACPPMRPIVPEADRVASVTKLALAAAAAR